MPTPLPHDKILRRRLLLLRRALKDVRGGDPSAIHHARIATRRLRELVPLLGLDPNVTRTVVRHLRKAGRRLGRLRDIDARLELLDQLLQSHSINGSRLRALRDDIDIRRADERRRLAKGSMQRRLDVVWKTLRATPGDATRSSASRTRRLVRRVDRRLVHRAAALSAAIRQAGTTADPERLHGVRIGVKKLRYAVEIAADAGQRTSPASIPLLKRVQDALGGLRDAHLLLDRVRRNGLGRKRPDERAAREGLRLEAALEVKCRRLHGRFRQSRLPLLRLCARMSAAPPGSRQRKEPDDGNA